MNVKVLISKLLVLSKSATFVLVTAFFMVPSSVVAQDNCVNQFRLHHPPGFGLVTQFKLHHPPGFLSKAF